ncbi:HTR3A, partial [Symbiodinium sp. KB8]
MLLSAAIFGFSLSRLQFLIRPSANSVRILHTASSASSKANSIIKGLLHSAAREIRVFAAMPTPAETTSPAEAVSLPPHLSSEAALKDYLESCGVNTSKFGTGGTKTMSWLFQELKEGSSFLEQPCDSSMPGHPGRPKIMRVVEPIFIRLRFRSRVLVQERQQFPDGRTRVRNMLLAEKKEPRDSGGLLAAIHRGIHEELGVSLEDLGRDDVIRYRPDTYHFEIEQIDSASYPGLPSSYRTHHVQVEILETGLDVFLHCGLPEFSDFVTKEKTAQGEVTLFWRWDDVPTALRKGVVKFPPKSLTTHQHGVRPSLHSVHSNGSISEKNVASVHFSKVKSHYRGTPSRKDALLGEYLESLKTFREADRFVFPTLSVGEPLDEPEDLARDALDAGIHQSRPLRGERPRKAGMLMMQRWGIRTVPMPGVEVLADEEENEAEAEAGKAEAQTKAATEASAENAAEEPTWPADNLLDVCRLVQQLRELPNCQDVPISETNLQCLLARMNEMRFSQLGGGQRMSRLEGWRSQQQQLLDKPVHSTAAACGPVTHFGSHSSLQILLFVREDGTLALGYCLSVYRGAPISGTATRTFKASRPSARPIPAGLMLEFVQSLQRTWIGTLLNPVHMIDPTSACGQTKASNVQQNADRLTVTFSTPSTCKCIAGGFVEGLIAKIMTNRILAVPDMRASSSYLNDRSINALTVGDIPDDAALASYLRRAGIDPTAYGTGKAKTIAALLKEVVKGETVLAPCLHSCAYSWSYRHSLSLQLAQEWNDSQSQIRRVVEPVFIQLRWGDKAILLLVAVCTKGHRRGQVLVETEQILSDGRPRQRNMLMAEKKSPEDVDIEHSALRGVKEELLENVPGCEIDVLRHLRFMQEAYCCVAENLESNSFPGLPCVYITHYCGVQILDNALPLFKDIGFLETDFETKESDGKINKWRWVDVSNARQDKVKGFPKLEEDGKDQAAEGLWQQLDTPQDPGDLRVLLEMGGVNVTTWGMYTEESLKCLLDELKIGASTLERDDVSGKVRRAICSNLVQLKVDEEMSQQGQGFGLGDARRMVRFRPERGVWEVVQSDTSSYPGLPCCYQTRLVQFDAKQKEFPRKMPSDASINGLPQVRRPSFTDNLNGGAPPGGTLSSGPCSPKSAQSVSSIPGSLYSESPVRARAKPAENMQDTIQEIPDKDIVGSGLYLQVLNMHKDLRFRMVAKESSEKAPPPASQAVACSCEILLIRNINPLTATYQCRFFVFMEWFDPSAVGMPLGDVSEENRKKLSIPEIALQNTLKTGLEIHSPPEVIHSERGHVAAKILYQAVMQMEIDMRLFPFDTQRLNIVLGLRARRDRDRAIFCRFCHCDSQIRLDEWKILGTFFDSDRPDGRARVQFGVVIGRGYMYYVTNVLITLCAIASSSFAGYFLQVAPPFDRLRFGVSILFAQTTFRLSIDSKLPIVAYATAFDHFAMCCQLLLLSMIVGDVIVAMLADRWFHFGGMEAARIVDKIILFTLMPLWLLALVIFSIWVVRKRQKTAQAQALLNHEPSSSAVSTSAEGAAHGDFSEEAMEQVSKLKNRLRYTSARRLSPTMQHLSSEAVVVSGLVWFLHDIDPIQAQYECKFTLFVEWLSQEAVGMKAGTRLSQDDLARHKAPEIDVHNKVELSVEDGPSAMVADSETGRIVMCTRYMAKLQLRLKLRNFPFDWQSLPIDFTMPAEKDVNRAFVCRSLELQPLAKTLDEWTFQGTWTSCDFHEGMSAASMYIEVKRRSQYYVVSVLGVMLGISSLVFTVFAIQVNTEGAGFDDQGKILISLLMTLLAFKLLTASGKIPKVAKATIFDRYVLATETCFFATVLSCTLMRLVISDPGMARFSMALRGGFFAVLLCSWLFFNVAMVFKIRRSNALANAEILERQGRRGSVHGPGFDEQALIMSRQPRMPEIAVGPQAVLLEVNFQHVFGINPAAANFTCVFEVRMAWLDERAKACSSSMALDAKRCQELGQPKLTVQNAQSTNTTFLSGRVVDETTGHVTCHLKIKAQVLLMFNLSNFPWDQQSLYVVLMLPSHSDRARHMVLTDLQASEDKTAKTGEWAELGVFGASYRITGISKAVFGLEMQRFSRYYVTSLLSMCLWSTFILFVYALDVNDFKERGKVMVGVLVVQNVAKVAVSSKMPRVVCITAYDKVALNSLALLFSIGLFTAFLDFLSQLELQWLNFEVLTIVDRVAGALFCLTWLALNIRAIWHVRRNSSKAESLGLGRLPRSLSGLTREADPDPDIAEQLEILRRPSDPLGKRPLNTVRKTSRSSDGLGGIVTVKLGVKFWLVSDIDVAAASFMAKFHVIMEWVDQAAVGMPQATRISHKELQKAGPGHIVVPNVSVRNAITVALEEYSDIIVLDEKTGRITCRLHINAVFHNDYCLDSFPFDCQRLVVEMQLIDCEGFELAPSFCDAADQSKNLDGWNVKDSVVALAPSLEENPKQKVKVCLLAERQAGFYVKQVLSIYWFLSTLMFSFFVLPSSEFTKRLVDILKIVLTQTTFRFSVEHRLPKVQHWTPFDIYLISCQMLACLIVGTFMGCYYLSKDSSRACFLQEIERALLVGLAALWVLWNLCFVLYAIHRKKSELLGARLAMRSGLILPQRISSGLLPRFSRSPRQLSSGEVQQVETLTAGNRDSELPLTPQYSRGSELRAFTNQDSKVGETQVISIAFRIWLIRNVDLVKATFECKFRVFLEWLDESAVGLEKGKKAKELKVPSLAITNAIQAEVIDRSSAPEVVNPKTGHVAVQMLFRATLRMDQQVRHFPFDCQWLAITVSLKEEGCARNRSFLFQYCEVDEGLSLDEWYICPDPAFSTLTKHDAPSIQDTVMCGLLIRRASRYYVVNIMLMLGLISSVAFAIYTVDVSLFWERAEVFLGIFPLIVVFKMSAQGKLPRVGYSTKFDQFAMACQMLFLIIVMGCTLRPQPGALSASPCLLFSSPLLYDNLEKFAFFILLAPENELGVQRSVKGDPVTMEEHIRQKQIEQAVLMALENTKDTGDTEVSQPKPEWQEQRVPSLLNDEVCNNQGAQDEFEAAEGAEEVEDLPNLHLDTSRVTDELALMLQASENGGKWLQRLLSRRLERGALGALGVGSGAGGFRSETLPMDATDDLTRIQLSEHLCLLAHVDVLNEMPG